MARHSPANVLLHVVWSTFRRAPLLEQSQDKELAALLASKAKENGCRVVATGIAIDHIHVVLGLSTTATIATVVGEMKGFSSRARTLDGAAWGWQRGYWVESVSPSDVDLPRRYLRRQREPHDDSHPAEIWMRGSPE